MYSSLKAIPLAWHVQQMSSLNKLKGNRSEAGSWLENRKCMQISNCKLFYQYPKILFDFLLNNKNQKKWPFCFKFELVKGKAVLFIHSLQMQSRKRGAHDVDGTFATHSSLVHVTDTYRWGQNGGTHGQVFITFKYQFLTDKARNQVKNRAVFCFVKKIKNLILYSAHVASLFQFSFLSFMSFYLFSF